MNTVFAQAACAILLCFYFGWRCGTLAKLTRGDLAFSDELGVFEFSERFSKGALSSQRCFRVLQIHHSVYPAVSAWLSTCPDRPPEAPLFPELPPRRPLEGALEIV